MMRCVSALLIWLLLPAIAWAAPGNHFPDAIEPVLNRITAEIYNDNFAGAESLLDSLCTTLSPPAPVCRMFRATIYQSHMMAAENDTLEHHLFAQLDSLEAAAGNMLENGDDSALAWYYLGQAHAYRALYLGRSGKLLDAIGSGLKARSAYIRGYTHDSSFHDIALGLGSYRYWKSVKTEFINWTPLVKNEWREGIRLLKLAADSSEISREAARTSLLWVYINEGDYDAAIRLADRMRREYPEGLTFHWALGQAFFEMKDYRMASSVYQSILNHLLQKPGNYYNIVEAGYYLSRCYRRLSQNDPIYVPRLERLRIDIASYPIPVETRRRQADKLDDINGPLAR